MSGLEFTEDAARQLERLYLTGDVVAQRSETIKLLALGRGERVLDVGCGPGFLCEDIAEVVGRNGAVTGIDISGDLIALCKRRSPPTWLSYFVGDAASISQPDASFDVVACTQVAEYVSDVDCVVSEAFLVTETRRTRRVCCHGLGRPRVAFGKAGPHGAGHEVLGSALRPSPLAEITRRPVGQRRFPLRWCDRLSNPQSAVA